MGVSPGAQEAGVAGMGVSPGAGEVGVADGRRPDREDDNGGGRGSEQPLRFRPYLHVTAGGGEIKRYMASDGEISPELQRALDAQPVEGISLSELLGH